MVTSLDKMEQRLQGTFPGSEQTDASSSLSSSSLQKFSALLEGGEISAPNDDGEFVKGVKRGIPQTEALLQAGVGAVGKALGFDKFAENRFKDYREITDSIDRDLSPAVSRVEDIDSIESFAKWAAGVTGEQIPFIAGALISGGAGGLAGFIAKGAARRGLQNITEEVALTAAKKAIQGSITKSAEAGTFSFASLSGTGEITSDALDGGLELDPFLAVGGGVISGALETMPIMTVMKSFGLGGKFTSGIMGTIASLPRAKKGLALAGVVSGQEAGTEALQSVVENVALSIIDENFEVLGEEGKSRILNGLAAGAVGGFAFGGAGGVLSPRGEIQEDKSFLSSILPEKKPVKTPKLITTGPGVVIPEGAVVPNRPNFPDIREPATLVEAYGVPGMAVEEIILEDVKGFESLADETVPQVLLTGPKQPASSATLDPRATADPEVILVGERSETPSPVHGQRTYTDEAADANAADLALRFSLNIEDEEQGKAAMKGLRAIGRSLAQGKITEENARKKASSLIKAATKRSKAKVSAQKTLAIKESQTPARTVVTTTEQAPTGATIQVTTRDNIDPVQQQAIDQQRLDDKQRNQSDTALDGQLSSTEQSRKERLIEKESIEGLSEREYSTLERLMAKETEGTIDREAQDLFSLEQLFRDEDGDFLRQAVKDELNPEGVSTETLLARASLAVQEVMKALKGLPLLEGKGTGQPLVTVVYSPIHQTARLIVNGEEHDAGVFGYEKLAIILGQEIKDGKTAQRLLIALERDGSRGAGLVHRLARNVVFINGDRAVSKNDIQKTILHEFVIHSGFSRLFNPAELTQFLSTIARLFNFDAIAHIYRDVDGNRLDIGAFAATHSFDNLDAVQTQNVRGLVEEGIAKLAEENPKTSKWNKIVIWIRQMLRRVFKGMKISETELRFIAEQTAIAVREPIFANNRFRAMVFPYLTALETETKAFKIKHPNLMRGPGGAPLLMFHATNVQEVAQLEGPAYLYKPFDTLLPSQRHGVLSTAETSRNAESFTSGKRLAEQNATGLWVSVNPGQLVYPIYIESKSQMDFEVEADVQKYLKAYIKWRATVTLTNPNQIQEDQIGIGVEDGTFEELLEKNVREGHWVFLENPAVLKAAGFDAVYTQERGKNLHVLEGSQTLFAMDLVKGETLSVAQKIVHSTAQGPAKQVSDVLLRLDVLNDRFGRDLSSEGTQAVADIMSLQKLWQMRSMLAFMTPLQLSKKVKLEPVVRYIAAVERWWNTRIGTIQEGSEVVERWRGLGKDQSQRLAKAIFEISLRSDDLNRKLSGEEIALELSRRGLDKEAQQIYMDMSKGMDNLLDRMQLGLEKNAVWEMATEDADATVRLFEEARKQGPSALEEFYSRQSNVDAMQVRVAEITKEFDQLRNRNYFPRSRFGKYAVTGIALQDIEIEGRQIKRGKIGFFATFENVKEMGIARKKFAKDHPSMLWKDGKLADKEFAFLGMPPSLMESIETKLKLTPSQKEALKEVWISLGPGRGFLKHMTKRKGVAGYSEDAMRTYASYMMNAAGHLARLEHHIPLTKELKQLNSIAKLKDPVGTRDEKGNVVQADLPVDAGKGVVLGEVRDYFQTHYEYIMNPGNDLAQIRAMGFLWYLGANPRSAAVNLTQVPMVTYPWLAERFGDVKSVGSIMKAYKDVVSTFRDLKNSNMEPDLKRMIAEGIRAGWLDESLAVDLAGIADAPTLERIAPASAATRRLNDVSYYGAYLFHKAELFNRRVTATAAFRLAKDKGLDYNASFEMAKDAVQSSQFEYAKWNRAAFMRGKRSVFFLFWNYVQQATFLAFGGEGKGTAMRFWGMLLLMAGMQGLPFGDDLMTLYDFLMTKLGKATGAKDPRSAIREDIRGLAADLGANPDIVMHGLGRYYGLGPMHLLSAFGVPVSNTDISASLGLGRVLPGFEDLTGKETDPEKRLARTAVEAGGPVVGVGYNFWRLAFEESPDRWKAWERTLPTAMKNLSKALRFYKRDGETLTSGAELLSFENRPDRASIIAAQALGFGPTEVAKAYEKRFAQREAAMFYRVRRENLLRDLGWVASLGDREGMRDVKKAIRLYNKELGVKAFRITGEEIKRSLKQKRRRLRLTEAGLPNERKFRKLYHEVGRNYD